MYSHTYYRNTDQWKTLRTIMNIWTLKCLAMEIIFYRLVKICKDCSGFPDENNNKQFAVTDCCRLGLLLSLFQGISFKQK